MNAASGFLSAPGRRRRYGCCVRIVAERGVIVIRGVCGQVKHNGLTCSIRRFPADLPRCRAFGFRSASRASLQRILHARLFIDGDFRTRVNGGQFAALTSCGISARDPRGEFEAPAFHPGMGQANRQSVLRAGRVSLRQSFKSKRTRWIIEIEVEVTLAASLFAKASGDRRRRTIHEGRRRVRPWFSCNPQGDRSGRRGQPEAWPANPESAHGRSCRCRSQTRSLSSHRRRPCAARRRRRWEWP